MGFKEYMNREKKKGVSFKITVPFKSLTLFLRGKWREAFEVNKKDDAKTEKAWKRWRAKLLGVDYGEDDRQG